MDKRKLGWIAWSILPVLGLVYHFGPGQGVYRQDRAAGMLVKAASLDERAQSAQNLAHERHLAWVSARKQAIASKAPADERAAEVAAKEADEAYALASSDWRATAEQLGSAQGLLDEIGSPKSGEVRVARNRALIRAGEISAGVNDLESLLSEMTDKGLQETSLAKQARAEMAAGYYYGARLLRLSGKPTSEWMEAASWARQNFRYIAEAEAGTPGDQQKNLELALNLEQHEGDDLVALPLARNSPCNGNCENLGKGKGKGKKKQPSENKDSRGAGGEEDIPPGW